MRRVRVGVLGAGKIAQVEHLPYLRELEDRFEIAAICDLSPYVAQEVARQYHVSRWHTDYRDMLADDIDVVLITTTGSHGPAIVQAAGAGKHVLAEKPMCYRLDEADEVIETVDASKVVAMIGHMKRHDPVFAPARDRVQRLEGLSFVRVTSMEGPSIPVFYDFPLVRGTDIPESTRSALERSRLDAAIAATGAKRPNAAMVTWFTELVLEGIIHEINVLNGILAPGLHAVQVSHWDNGQSMSATLKHDSGITIAFAFLKVYDLITYFQEFCFYGRSSWLQLRFPHPYLKNAPTNLYVERPDAGAVLRETIEPSREESFRAEWLHFYDCVTNGAVPLTSTRDARQDLEVAVDLARVAAAAS